MNEGGHISRRAFLAGGAIVVSTSALGVLSISLTGCSAQEPVAEGAVLRIEGQRFYIGDDTVGTEFSGHKVSLMPDMANGMVTISFTDTEGNPEKVDFVELGTDFTLTGEHNGHITVDSVQGSDSLHIDENANFDSVGLGTLDNAVIMGTLGHIVIIGGTSVELGDSASVEHVIIGHSDASVSVAEGANLETVHALDESQTPEEVQTDLIVAREDVLETHVEFFEGPDEPPVVDTEFSEDGTALSLLQDEPVELSDEEWDALIQEVDAEVLLEVPNDENAFDAEGNAIEPEVSEDIMASLRVEDASAFEVPLLDEEALNGPTSSWDLLFQGLDFLGQGLAGSAISWGTSTLLNMLFGPQDLTPLIIQKLDEIKAQLDVIERMIAQIVSELMKTTFATQVNNYLSEYSAKMKAGLSFLDGYAANVDKVTDVQQRATDQQTFASNMLVDSNYFITGLPVQKAALIFGEEILQVYAGTNTNLFGAMDGLCVYTYRWEHHGYTNRANFQLSVLSFYTSLVAYAKLALNRGIEETRDDPSKRDKYFAYLTDWENLFGSTSINDEAYFSSNDYTGQKIGNVKQVMDMADKQKVVPRANTVRYYQVPGHEVQIGATSAMVLSSSSAGTSQDQMMRDSAGHMVLTQQQLATIYADYDGQKSLAEIFFTPEEGNIQVPGSFTLKFVGYSQPLIKEKYTTLDTVRTYYRYYAPTVHNAGKQDKALVVDYGPSTRWYNVALIGVFRV